MDELRSDGSGTVHLVVLVPRDEAESRVAAGVAAGGRMIRHNVEEAFWTLADPAGNEVDIATPPPATPPWAPRRATARSSRRSRSSSL